MITSVQAGITAVGYIDWAVRDFHGYDTQRGSTYNSYLLQFEKTALVDTVKEPFATDLLMNLVRAGVAPEAVDYVIVNHAEPDHSGALPALLPLLPNATVVCNKKTQEILGAYYNTAKWRFQLVKTGDTLSLGVGRTLQFIEMPMVHWPDSMATYLQEEQILFSNDAFGQHYATSRRFDDENDLPTLLFEAKSYYANIVNPYSKRVAAVLAGLANVPMKVICPSHGVIWRSHIAEILEAYQGWAAQRVQPKVTILFDSMWHRTEKMVSAIQEGVASVPGVVLEVLPVRAATLNQLATAAIDTACFALGSSTLNQQMMPQMAAAICYLQGLNFPGRAAFSFGSHGWGKGGPELLSAKIAEMRWTETQAPIVAKYEPTAEILTQCTQAGQALAEKALELAAK